MVTIIFDKTGTLTEGRFGVTDTLVLSQDIDEDTLRAYAAAVDATNSEHPFAKALDEYFAEVLPKDNAAKVKEVQSRGVMVAIFQLSRATYRKMIQNLVWATWYNVVVIPLAAGAFYSWGVLLTPAVGAALMSASTVIVAIDARLLRLKK